MWNNHEPLKEPLTGPKQQEIKAETFKIDHLVRTPKVEKLSLQPIRPLLVMDRGPTSARFGQR